jgi:hydrogenase/urease accessory protein HupE
MEPGGSPVILLLLGLLIWVPTVCGHNASSAYLELHHTNATLRIRFEVAIRDIDDLLNLDANADGFVVWEEIRSRESEFLREVDRTVKFSAGSDPLAVVDEGSSAVRRAEGGYVRFDRRIDGVSGNRLRLEYGLFAVRDPLHRALVKFEDESGMQTAVVGPSGSVAEFAMAEEGRASGAMGFFREGVHHIRTGYDHLAFLFALLLPAVLRRSESGWKPVEDAREAVVPVVRIVSAFTMAHSMTLGLAAAGWVRLPERWVESAIAGSILVAVAANAFGKSEAAGKGWVPRIRAVWLGQPATVALVFGWIHGFGFAGALGELGLKQGDLVVPLLCFNLGVESGQLACVAVFLPVAYQLRNQAFYRRFLLPVGSLLIALTACGWLVDRVLDLGWMPF